MTSYVVDDVRHWCKSCNVELSADTHFHNAGFCSKCKLKIKNGEL